MSLVEFNNVYKRYKTGEIVINAVDGISFKVEEGEFAIVVGASGADAVDLALVNLCKKGDIAVTQDYGVAALVLGKGAYCIHQSGKIFSDDNIGGLLMDRHLAKKARMSNGKHHIKGPFFGDHLRPI